jgi:hypothetical protein
VSVKRRAKDRAAVGIDLLDDMALRIGPSLRVLTRPDGMALEVERLRELWTRHGGDLARSGDYGWALETFGDPTQPGAGPARSH